MVARKDDTVGTRKRMVAQEMIVCSVMTDEQILKGIREEYPDACDTSELTQQYEVHGFAAPFVVVTRKSDGAKGSMEFIHQPRIYYNFSPA